MSNDSVAERPPQPNGAFEWVQAPAGDALVCRPLAASAANLFTTRRWRFAEAGAADTHRYADLARALQVEPDQVVRLRQVHGAAVVVASEAASRLTDGDILISDDPSKVLVVQAADCVPLLLADRRATAVAAAHAGWRGLAAGVPHAAVSALVREFGSRPLDIVAAAGPSVGPCCYEVGLDVRDAFAGFGHAALARWFSSHPLVTARNPSMPNIARRAARWFFDGWTALRDQLEAAGVPAEQIFIAGLCTASHPDVFCSYRRDGSRAGRLAAAIRGRPRRP
jgi:YfiH family protein